MLDSRLYTDIKLEFTWAPQGDFGIFSSADSSRQVAGRDLDPTKRPISTPSTSLDGMLFGGRAVLNLFSIGLPHQASTPTIKWYDNRGILIGVEPG